MSEHLHHDNWQPKHEFNYGTRGMGFGGGSHRAPEKKPKLVKEPDTPLANIGVIGIGEFGSKMVSQILNNLGMPVIFDKEKKVLPKSTSGITASTGEGRSINTSGWRKSADEVLSEASFVHWCAPLNALGEIQVPEDTTLMLHDSVMSSSHEAAKQLRGLGRCLGSIAILHCLMDEHGTVDVSKDSDNVDRVICHLEDLGLRPILIDADEHDKRMAAQQGVNLLNFEVNRGKLEDSAGIRQIVKSASKILEVFKGQEKSWTPITTESVLKNPFIKHQLVEMAARLAQAQGITTQEIIEEMLAIETTQRKKRRG